MKTIFLLIGKSIKWCFFILTIILSDACEGPEGPPGPQGQNGYDGIDGINYNGSVIYDVPYDSWSGDANGYTVTLNVPEIDNSIYETGAVLVYRLIEVTPKSFNMLPYTYVDNDLTIYMDFDVYIGSIDLIYKEIEAGTNATIAPSSLMSFKVVIIQAVPISVLQSKVDITDYNAVVEYLASPEYSEVSQRL